MAGIASALARLKSRERILLGVAVAAVALAFADRAVVGQIRGRLRDLDRDIRLSEVQVSGNYRILAQKNGVGVEFDRIRHYVPSAADSQVVPRMFTEIEELARGTGVNLIDRKAQASEKMDFFEMFAVRVEVEASREALAKWLWQIEMSPQLLRVNRIELARSSKGTPGLLKGVLVITKAAPLKAFPSAAPSA